MILLRLIWAWLLLDYALQGDFMARTKNHKYPDEKVPWVWPWLSHAFLQAGGVYLVTWSLTLSMIEFVAHAAIDYCKADERLTYSQDQSLHLICRIVYAIALSGGFV
jgi:hypothetical protein